MASGEEPKQVNFVASSNGANPETIRAVQEGIQEVLNKFKDAQGVIYVTIENLNLHPNQSLLPGPPHHEPPRHGRPDHPPPPYFGHRLPHYGPLHHGRPDFAYRHHSFHHDVPLHHWWGHSHGERHFEDRHRHRRHHFWWPSPQCTETEATSGEETGGETSGRNTTQPPPCWSYWSRKHGKGRRHGRSRSRSCCKNNEKENETIDLTKENKENGETNLKEQFDSMNVQSP